MNFAATAETLADLPVRGEDARKASYLLDQFMDERRIALATAGNRNADLGALMLAAADLIHRYTR